MTPWVVPTGRLYARPGEWGTTGVGLGKLRYGRTWTPEDYMDLVPPFPDMTSHDTRRASAYTPFKQSPVALYAMSVRDICDEYTRLKNRVPSVWNEAWIVAFEQELEYRANRSSYEIQGQGRTDTLG